jgi:hypothetical protein
MSRPAGAVYFAALLLVASGCSPASFLLSAASPGGKQQYVAGSVDQVSAHLQASLGRFGIHLVASRDHQDVLLSGITRSGKRFALRLKQQNSPSGEKTVVSINWDAEEEVEFWGLVVDMLLAPPLPDPYGAPPPPVSPPNGL